MVFRELLRQAKSELPGMVSDVLEHQLEHASVYFVAHNLAAGHYRSLQRIAKREGKHAEAWWYMQRARWHRIRRRHFRRLVEAKDKAQQCKGVLSCLEL